MAMRAKRQPLYDQLVDILSEKIEYEYRPGDLMPSERELSERYGLSRTTVRLALQELERLGLVVRQHGRGTFVADRSARTTNLLQAYSFTDQMIEMGRVPETTILEFSEHEADAKMAECMQIRPGDRIFKLKRLRSADGMPMMVERSYLLGIGENAPVLDLVRTTYNVSNEVVEYTLSVARGDQFKYKVYHHRRD